MTVFELLPYQKLFIFNVYIYVCIYCDASRWCDIHNVKMHTSVNIMKHIVSYCF